MKFGAISVQREPVATLVEKAELAEEVGFDILGFGDSQTGFRELYTTLGVIAHETESIRLGPMFTNPVTRHPAVTASAICTVHEITDGRSLLGIATGDSAVRTLGKRPAKLSELEEAIRTITTLGAGDTATYEESQLALRWIRREGRSYDIPVYVAAEGPKSLKLSGKIADSVVIGTGLTPALIEQSIDRIHEGAREAGRDPEAIDMWVYGQVCIDDTFEEAVDQIKASLAGGAHHRYQHTFEGKDVPEEYQEPIRKLVSEYDPMRHVERGETTNAELVDKYELGEFLGNRIAIAGPVSSCQQQIAELAGIERLSGILIPTLVVDDEQKLIRQLGERIIPEITG